MEQLTKRQNDVLKYLKSYINEHGYSPCVRDICTALNLRSTSTAHAHLTKLEKKGYITRDPAKPRTTMILGKDSAAKQRMVSVPVVGKVAAGYPITAVENIDEYISLPYSLLGSDDVFILNVSGDSMIDAGIFDKDKIIAQKQDYAQNGDIVVALLDDEATVKRFYIENDRVRLQAENENYAPIYARDIDILGKVIGVLRMFR
ncbi:MAG: transcriptional repressor LexA [Eubacteriales bacterium]|nr:transcriptional repressor LexA [Eubacteriales bacterium]